MVIFDPEKSSINFVRFKPGRRFYVFIISLALASGFWLLSALNKTYSEVIEIPIKYINLPEDQAFIPVPPSVLTVSLNGDGYSLIEFKDKTQEDTVVVDIAALDFESIGNRNRATVPTLVILEKLRSELNNNVVVSRVSRDSIEVVTERGIFKELNVKPNVSLSLAKGVVLKNAVYSIPEKVRVRGPISVLVPMVELSTQLITLEDIEESQEVIVKLAFNRRILFPEFNSVKTIVEVEALTEGEISVPIHVSGMPEGKKIRLLPNSVDIHYSTGLSNYDIVTADLFDVIVKYEDIVSNKSKLLVELRTYPSYINIIQFLPQRVGYLKMDVENIDE